MKVTPIKTQPITPNEMTVEQLLEAYVPTPKDHSIIAITSKVISLCEGAVAPVEGTSKEELVRKEADLYLDPKHNQYGATLTVRDNVLIAWAGVDQSNSKDCYVLWPRDPQRSANAIRQHYKDKGIQVGVIITDSHVSPLRKGTTGLGLAHSGFAAIRDYIGTPDIFGRKMSYTASSILDGLSSAAVLLMGEGSEQTPIATIEDVGFVDFQDRDPTPDELSQIRIPLDEDLYAEMLRQVPWEK